MERADIEGAVALQRACFPPPFPGDLLWRPEHLVRHIEVFPEGQWVVEADDRVVASASAVRISEAAWEAHSDWDATVGGFFFGNYDPLGSTLYGADISVHPDWRGRGLGRMLYGARFQVVRELGLRRFGTACRLPGFAASGIDGPTRYAEEVALGRRTDRTLTPLLRYGLRLAGTIEGYMDDEESGNAAAILEWTP